jgi:hypothetical protein
MTGSGFAIADTLVHGEGDHRRDARQRRVVISMPGLTGARTGPRRPEPPGLRAASAHGKDPVAERRAYIDAPIANDLLDRYIAEHARGGTALARGMRCSFKAISAAQLFSGDAQPHEPKADATIVADAHDMLRVAGVAAVGPARANLRRIPPGPTDAMKAPSFLWSLANSPP